MLPTMILSCWLVLALGGGHFQLLQKIPAPAIQAILLLLTATLLLLFFFQASFRRWILNLDLRVLILYHLIRFVGLYFIFLYSRGELPYDFAVKGGVGDTIVAVLALPMALLPLHKRGAKAALSVWNLFGLLDILFVVVTAARLGIQDPANIRALTVLPLSLLPTFVVPLIIASHVFIAIRLKSTGTAERKKSLTAKCVTTSYLKTSTR